MSDPSRNISISSISIFCICSGFVSTFNIFHRQRALYLEEGRLYITFYILRKHCVLKELQRFLG